MTRGIMSFARALNMLALGARRPFTLVVPTRVALVELRGGALDTQGVA